MAAQNGLDRPTVRDVARHIHGTSRPPLWLIEGLQHVARVGSDPAQQMQEEAILLSTQRRRLDAIRSAARLLRRELPATLILSRLDQAGPGWTPLAPGMLDWLETVGRSLDGIAQRARQAVGSLPAREEDDGSGRLRDGPNPPGPNERGFDARGKCAVIVQEAWSVARGTRRGSKAGEEIAYAADAYWLACGGPWLPGQGSSGWRRAFTAAQRADDAQRAVIRRCFDVPADYMPP